MRAPPPGCGCVCGACTGRPGRAQITVAANPLGPLPTTVTSSTQVDPIRLAG